MTQSTTTQTNPRAIKGLVRKMIYGLVAFGFGLFALSFAPQPSQSTKALDGEQVEDKPASQIMLSGMVR